MTVHITIFCVIVDYFYPNTVCVFGCTLETRLSITLMLFCFHFKGSFSKRSTSKIQAIKFFEEFICRDLIKKDIGKDNLTKLKVYEDRAVLHFTNVNQINSIYSEIKHKGGERNYFKIQKNYVKSNAKILQDNGLRRVGKGMKNNKKYLKYEVDQSSELWDFFSTSYKAQTISRMVMCFITYRASAPIKFSFVRTSFCNLFPSVGKHSPLDFKRYKFLIFLFILQN